jgi:hypothetical protein
MVLVEDLNVRVLDALTPAQLVGRGMGYALLVQRPANDRAYEGKGNRVVIKEITEPVGEARLLLA